FSNKHAGCRRACTRDIGDSPESLATSRTLQDLAPDEVILGAEAAERSGLAPGNRVKILGHSFTVKGIMPATGTVDDGRVFAHLHTVQEAAQAGMVVNAIEIMGC